MKPLRFSVFAGKNKNMKTKSIIIILLLLFGGRLSAQDTLTRYLETAAKNNPALKARFNQYMAALEKAPQVGTLPDPQVTFGYFILPVETKNGPQQFKISATQMFPWFGTLGKSEEVAVSRAKAKYELFEEAKSNLFFEVKSSYYKLYFLKKSMAVTNDNIRILKTFKNLALIKMEAGTASGVDELRVEMELADLENTLALLRDRYFSELVSFNNLLNVDENSPVDIPETLWMDDLPFSRQAVLDSLKQNNNQLQSLDYMFRSYKEQEAQAKSKGAPNILAGIDYINVGDNGVTTDGGKDALFVKVGITIPLYRRKYNSMVKEAVLLQEATQYQKEDKINALETLFEKVYTQYNDATRRIALFSKQSELASKAIRILESDYASSGKAFEEILRMERKLLKYSLELEKARSDKQAAIAFVNYLMGR